MALLFFLQLEPEKLMGRALKLLYGIAAYAISMAAIVYAVGFVGNLGVPKSIDSGEQLGLTTEAVIIDLALLGLFAIQHSVMARPAFKRAVAPVIPAAIERSTYVLASALALGLLYWQWRPIAGAVWTVTNPSGAMALQVVQFLGWGIVVGSTFLISHTDLFGLRQVYDHWTGAGQVAPVFKTPLLYNLVRHPIYLGFLLAVWSTPVMTLGHLLFAVGVTGYILVGATLEERDLVTTFGDAYRQYRSRVPMLLPTRWRR